MRDIITRYCKTNDNTEDIVDLVIGTDEYIYPPMFFENPTEKYLFFFECMSDHKSMFARERILVAEIDGKIVGILVAFDGGEELRLATDQTISKYKSEKNICYCNEHYFIPLINDYKYRNEIRYISNICVDERYRGMGVAGRLMRHYFELSEKKCELDVLCDNQKAIHLYRNWGFDIAYSEPAFAFPPTRGLKSYRMIQKNKATD